MLRELHIHNLAVISEARVELAPGLNCFTGATGAGKSLIIGAVEVLLGLRSPGEMLRKGVEEGRVSGLFEVDDPGVVTAIERIVDSRLSNELLLTRRLFASGRSSVSLNGQPITLAMLKAVSEHLVDVHGQHDHQYLLKPSNQLLVLDEYAEVMPLRKKYDAVWRELTESRRRLAELSEGRSLRQQQLELHRFQASEIDAAQLNAVEFEQLRSRAMILGNAEKLQREAGGVHGALVESDENLVGRVKAMASDLAELAEIDVTLANIARSMKDAAVALEEGAFDLGRYLSRLDLDPKELDDVNARLTEIQRLASKYASRIGRGSASAGGDEVESVMAYRLQIGREIAALESQTEDLSGIESRLGPLEAEARKLAGQLSVARRKAGARLSREIESALAELGMERAKFVIQQEPASELTPTGADQIEFIATTNPGLSPAPLRKIASGGELSRIMLALKGILAEGDRVSVLVFDEIDSNVGGRLGAIIGAKLRQLASRHQVLCITHLPQIAAYADRHLTVRKAQSKDETTSTVRLMEGDERVTEIAEMIGGEKITPTTRAQAKELLDAGASPRKTQARAAS